MKKWLVVLLLISSFSLSACANKSIGTTVPQENQKVENGVVVYKGINISMDAVRDGAKIKVQIFLENTTNNPIPLNDLDKNLIYVYANDKNGNNVYAHYFQEQGREQLLPKEKINFEDSFVSKQGSITIGAKLNVTDTNQYKYQQDSIQTVKAFNFGDDMSYEYVPKEALYYIYQSPNETMDMVENYQYFQDGFIQSKNNSEGMEMYLVDQTGLYKVLYQGTSTDENQIDKAKDSDKQLLLKFPVNLGDTWQDGNVTYQVTNIASTVQTQYQTFTDAVEIKETDATNNQTQYLYYQKDVGLVQMKQSLPNSSDQITWALKDILTPAEYTDQQKQIGYLPQQQTTYDYKNEITGALEKETFKFFEDGFTQSVDENNVAKNMYLIDKTGLYQVQKTMTNPQNSDVIHDSESGAKMLLLRFPVTRNDAWNGTNGEKYDVMSISETVQTPFKLFSDVIVVRETISDTSYKFFFYSKEAGLLQIKEGPNSNYVSSDDKTTLSLDFIE